MKILIILPGKYFQEKIGGAISHTTGVADAMKNLGHEVFFCSSNKIPDYKGKIKYHLLRIKESKIPKTKRIFRDIQIFFQLKNIVKNINPDILYIRWRQNIFWSSLFRNRNYKIIFECNTPSTMSLYRYGKKPKVVERSLTRYFDTIICNYADIISAVSVDVKTFLQKELYCKKSKIIINPNGVDVNRFSPIGDNRRKKYRISTNKIVIGYSGSFRQQHGVEILIEAFKCINNDNLVLMIIGKGNKEYEDRLKEVAGGDKRIIFTGEIPFSEMPFYLRTCNIVISPQILFVGDTFHQSPIKLFEYMAAGRAIIASDLGQIKQVIRDKKNGLLFKNNDVIDLRDCLNLLIHNKRLRETLSRNARIDAEKKYSWEKNVKRVLNALNKIS